MWSSLSDTDTLLKCCGDWWWKGESCQLWSLDWSGLPGQGLWEGLEDAPDYSSDRRHDVDIAVRTEEDAWSPWSTGLSTAPVVRVNLVQNQKGSLWRPLLPYEYRYIKHRVPYRVKLSFVIFDIWALWRSGLSVRVPRCQKLQMTV